MYRLLLATLTFGLALALLSSNVWAQSQQATAELKNAAGQVIGKATFTQQASGVNIQVQVSNLEPGPHGIHLHAVGKCDAPDFATAAGHFNPTSKKHGHENAEGPHAGDVGNPPNLIVGADHTGTISGLNNLVSLTSGPGSLLDDDGTALVIHAGPDDNKTDPSGNSGARVACGVLVSVAQALPRTGASQLSITVLTVVAGLALLGAGLLTRRQFVR